ncbi:MAG: hypothetical protein JW940_25145 [Polyangiaceae bacterium]|nr:hypothetical protein [Polyangiaceae bacterium]
MIDSEDPTRLLRDAWSIVRLDATAVGHMASLDRVPASRAGYHRSRTHLSLGKDSPDPRSVEPPSMGNVVELPVVSGLHHRYTRQAA